MGLILYVPPQTETKIPTLLPSVLTGSDAVNDFWRPGSFHGSRPLERPPGPVSCAGVEALVAFAAVEAGRPDSRKAYRQVELLEGG